MGGWQSTKYLGSHLQKLAFYLLILISLSSLVDLFTLSFWEIIRLAFICLGLVYLLWRTKSQIEQISCHDTLLFLALLVFMLTQFPGRGTSEGALWLARTGLLATGIVLLPFSEGQVPLLSKQDKWILCIGIFVGLSIVGSWWGTENALDSFGRWRGFWINLQVVLAYFFITRCFRRDRTAVQRLLTVILLIFGIVGGTGFYQVSSAAYHFSQTLEEFRNGEYNRVRNYASDASPLFSRLHVESLSVDHLLDLLSAEAAGKDWEAGAYATIGEIAEKSGDHQFAFNIFSEVYEREPTYPAIHAKLGRALMKMYYPTRALDVLRQGVEQDEVEVEDFLSLGSILCKVGRWEEANEALDSAIEMSGMRQQIEEIFASEKTMLNVELGEFLPEEFLLFLAEFSEFEIVRFLQLRGWEVLHPSMEIGNTGIVTPVDIEVWSEQQAYGRQEAIIVNGKQVSKKGWGRNLVVLDAESGKIESIAAIHPPLPGRTKNVISDFLKTIPQGKIVAGTILDTGGGSLSEEDIEELTALGTIGDPGNYIAQAFIGVKGAGRGTAFELRGNPLVGGGVLTENAHQDLRDDPQKLECSLREAAARSPGKVAIYIPRFDQDAEISIFRY